MVEDSNSEGISAIRKRLHDISGDIGTLSNRLNLVELEYRYMKDDVAEIKREMATGVQMEYITERIKEIRSVIVFIGGPIILAVLYAILKTVIAQP